MTSWHYVRGNERVGPVSFEDLEDLVSNGELGSESYVWTKGFSNWKKMGEVQELEALFYTSFDEDEVTEGLSRDEVEENENDELLDYRPDGVDWEGIDEVDRVIMLKIGIDRGCEESEYGPYNLKELQRAFKEKRINEKTFIFVPGMKNWEFLGDLPIYHELTPLPPKIEDEDRRKFVRKPFVARMLFHDNEKVFEGICRDVSIGGAQVLVSDFPSQIGEVVTMNVHPDNSRYGFVARGKIVRILENNSGFSLRFHDLSSDAKKAINNFVSEHS